MIYVVIILFIFIFLLVLLVLKNKKKLSPIQKVQFQKLFNAILVQSEIEKQIIQLDSLLCKVLVGLGYKGSFGEILKQKPKELSNIQDIWFAHKLRNTLAHEVEYKLTDRDGEKALEILTLQLKKLLN